MLYDKNILLKIFLSSSLSQIKVVDKNPISNKSVEYNIDDMTLYIEKGTDSPEIFYELSKELAKQEIGNDSSLDKFECECVGYMLCKKYGVNMVTFRLNNISSELQNMELKDVRKELGRIRDTFESVNLRMQTVFERISKESVKENVR
jgi:hypothetical protein